MKNKHTAGKWEVLPPDNGLIQVKNGNEYKNIALCCYGSKEESEANAQLIAHAPELLQMVYDLKQCIKALSQDDVRQFDRDTLAQWEGEAHELLTRINPDWYDNANKYRLSQNTTVQHNTLL